MNEQIEIEERMDPEFECKRCYDTGMAYSREGDEVFRDPCYCARGRALILNPSSL